MQQCTGQPCESKFASVHLPFQVSSKQTRSKTVLFFVHFVLIVLCLSVFAALLPFRVLFFVARGAVADDSSRLHTVCSSTAVDVTSQEVALVHAECNQKSAIAVAALCHCRSPRLARRRRCRLRIFVLSEYSSYLRFCTFFKRLFKPLSPLNRGRAFFSICSFHFRMIFF